jgi:hypothetical protein
VKKNPNIPKVAKMESIPVIGVEIKKLRTLPLLAPSFLKEAAKGTTPQEQTGRGVPKRVDFITQERVFPPKCLLTKSLGTAS